ncbi:hypothetical protein HY489_03255 [Candidatus Woesearchaeota archaeon]|nr:hypothetical protein [Candidatus Woesearchaeota archaeon]
MIELPAETNIEIIIPESNEGRSHVDVFKRLPRKLAVLAAEELENQCNSAAYLFGYLAKSPEVVGRHEVSFEGRMNPRAHYHADCGDCMARVYMAEEALLKREFDDSGLLGKIAEWFSPGEAFPFVLRASCSSASDWPERGRMNKFPDMFVQQVLARVYGKAYFVGVDRKDDELVVPSVAAVQWGILPKNRLISPDRQDGVFYFDEKRFEAKGNGAS